MKTVLILIVGTALGLHAQESSKLDANTRTATLEKYSNERDAQLTSNHDAVLDELSKSGVQIIKADITLTVTTATKIAFAWPVAGGQKADRSRIDKKPYVMTLYPGKDGTGKDIAQKWEISYKNGTAKALGQ